MAGEPTPPPGLPTLVVGSRATLDGLSVVVRKVRPEGDRLWALARSAEPTPADAPGGAWRWWSLYFYADGTNRAVGPFEMHEGGGEGVQPVMGETPGGN